MSRYRSSGAGAILVDAGPLVALIDRADRHHQACTRVLEALSGPMWTVWPAFTEAMYLSGFSRRAQAALWAMLESGAVELAPLGSGDASGLRELMDKYADLPMDLADAALVHVAERERIRRVFTLDRRDFAVYRPRHVRRFEVVP